MSNRTAAVWGTGGLGVGIVLGLLTACPPDRLTAQSVPPTIDTIVVVNRNVFDLHEADAPSFIARLANRLHVRTRAGVIRSTLLVNPGDRYDSARVAESERALRNLYVFSRVRIDTTRLEGRLALRVSTTDGWSTKPQIGYSSAGGDVTWMVGLVEDNLRLWLAGQWRRENFDSLGTTPFPRSLFGTGGVGIDLAHVRFQVLERFNSYARREDVDMSQVLQVGVWAAPRPWGYPSGQAGVGPEVSVQLAGPSQRGFAVLRAGANGVLTAGAPDSARVAGALTVASQNLRDQTLILHVEAAQLRRAKPGNEFDLWTSQNGPRVFGIHEFTGTRMVWLALEDRVLITDELWGLLGVGVAPFLDYGGAWYAGEPPRLGGDVGVSLRIGPTRAVRGDVADFAVGYRFGKGFAGSRWGFAIRKGVRY